MYKNLEDVVNNIDAIMAQAKNVADKRDFGMGIKRVYYTGGTLCIDLFDGKIDTNIFLMVNISTETYHVTFFNENLYTNRLLPIEALRTAFYIYAKTKGRKSSEYYDECFNKSCLRHNTKHHPITVKKTDYEN